MKLDPVPAWIKPELRSRLGDVRERSSWPTVSIVVPTSGTPDLLGPLLSGLSAETDYALFSVVVVVTGGPGDAAEWLDPTSFDFPVKVLEADRDLSFSAACNRGAAATAGELLLFLNDDIEPLEPLWLDRLVTSLEESGAALAGAVLVDPALRSSTDRVGAVHHLDLCFRPAAGLDDVLEPRPRGFGSDLEAALGPDRKAAAVTAACALVRRSAFESVQGFCELFDYGKEDVDLCLKLAAAGHEIVAGGSTVLLHRRGATRRTAVAGTQDVRRRNLRLLMERWGPRLRREYALDLASGRGVFSDGDPAEGEGDAGVGYCVLAADPAHADDARALVRDLTALGRRARFSTEGMGWLLDDVIVHVSPSPDPPPVIRGRTNVLVRLDGPRIPKRQLARFDLVTRGAPDAQRLADQVDAELERRGGPPRIEPRAGTAPAAPAAAPAIFVLGMARTGTSVTTRILNLYGADVGPEPKLMGPNADVNAKGFYEHFPLMQINVELLQRLGGSWRDLPDLTPGWELDPGLDDLRDQARRLIADDFAEARLWVFKDPRTSLTLPFWRPLLGQTRFVICFRNPLEVAESLARRDGLSLEQSVALWEQYTASAIAHTAGARRVFVGYGEYFDGRDQALTAVARLADTSASTESPELRAPVRLWLDAEMRHHRRTHRELVTEPAIGARAAKLFLLLELASRSRGREPGLAGARGGGPVSDALDEIARETIGPSRGAGTPSQDALRISGLEERIAAEMKELSRRAGADQPQPADPARFLFVCGCPRSGTTALTTFLNGDGRLLLGQERYRRVMALLEPFHFTEELFFNPSLKETSWAMPWRGETVFPGNPADYRTLRERWRAGQVQVLGDKAPRYHRHLDRIAESFPGARFVMLLRDLQEVARSYTERARNPADHWPAENDHRLAVQHWNEALADARSFLDGPEPERLLVVPYTEFFSGAPDQLDRLYAFLELDVPAEQRERYAEVNEEHRRRSSRQDAPLPDEVQAYLAEHGDHALAADVQALGATL